MHHDIRSRVLVGRIPNIGLRSYRKLICSAVAFRCNQRNSESKLTGWWLDWQVVLPSRPGPHPTQAGSGYDNVSPISYINSIMLHMLCNAVPLHRGRVGSVASSLIVFSFASPLAGLHFTLLTPVVLSLIDVLNEQQDSLSRTLDMSPHHRPSTI